MQPLQCDLHPRTQEQALVAKHIEGMNCARNDPTRHGGTGEILFISCSHFTRKNTPFVPGIPSHSTLAFGTASLPHHFLSSSTRLTISLLFFKHLPHHTLSSPLPILTASPLPLIITYKSQTFPFFTTSPPHHFPSSPRPTVINTHRHHFPPSPPPIVMSLHHHVVVVNTFLHYSQSTAPREKKISCRSCAPFSIAPMACGKCLQFSLLNAGPFFGAASKKWTMFSGSLVYDIKQPVLKKFASFCSENYLDLNIFFSKIILILFI
jgi:hypothetical protein